MCVCVNAYCTHVLHPKLYFQKTYQPEPDMLGDKNELQDELEKDMLIKELQKANHKKEVSSLASRLLKLTNYLFTQMDIIACREEISDKTSQIDVLKGLDKINKQLVTEISDLKVTKKGKSVGLQTDLVRLHLAYVL